MPLDRIEIPESALRPKPDFPTLPDKSVVEEVRDWVKSGNPTYTWRGHTHTKPGEGAEVQYVADFQLPKGQEAPCPCCTPVTAKFNTGLIAWFPETHLVRLMGQHCFRRINPEGHQAAYKDLQDRIRREGSIRYLIGNLWKAKEASSALERAKPIARHLDDLQDILGPKLKRTLQIDLWRYMRDGALMVVSGGTDGKQFYTRYSTVTGTQLLDPARTSMAQKVETAQRLLENLDLPDDIEKADDDDRDRVARRFNRAMRVAGNAIAEINECRQFVTPLNVATIRQWGSRLDAPLQVYMRREGLVLHIGQTEDEPRSINLDGCLDLPTPRLPEIVIE
ncbi:hypothetical protein [Bradyrhizobium australafricanum]|uniref:hypothetical protein n=1 Tax=Bradyrhizobium australafricanum TaxID=2821406 RepID=UPI001CE301E5|nr:hypothetical protein [Bradyrhizobium australafricanum]MCA6099202.1 hypothetical protein [Bradyrhizobium australafricanum]